MSRFLRTIAYAGLILSIAMLAYCFSVEQTQVLEGAPGASKSRMIAYFGGCVAVAVAMAVLFARDVTQFLGNRAVQFMLFGGREVTTAPELDEAERIRKSDPLEAVRVLREFLEKHPSELQVMARIGEIYERDLRNPLAAALEFEDLLKHKLEPERWSWSAIHLANLYLRLRQPDKAVALWQRILQEHGKTSAAIKARKRLAELET